MKIMQIWNDLMT